MIRRMFRQFGSMAVLSFAWKHRGSVVRGVDLAKRTPDLVRDGRTEELKVEAKAILALDQHLGDDTAIRISGIDDGSVMLKGQPAGEPLAAARAALTKVPAILDVRTDDVTQPTLDSLLATTAADGR
jgi:hypothetical protein